MFVKNLVNRDHVLHENSGRATEIHSHSKDGRPRDIGHKMSMVVDTRKSNFGSQ